MKKAFVFIAASLLFCHAGFGGTFQPATVPVVDTIADLTVRVPSQLYPFVDVSRFDETQGPWAGGPRRARYDAASTDTVWRGCIYEARNGGRWVFDDCLNGSPMDVSIAGAVPQIVPQVVQQTTALTIVRDSWPAFQATADLLAARGGGVMIIPAGMYKVSQTVVLGPNVHIRGASPVTLGQIDLGTTNSLNGQLTWVFGAATGNGNGFPVFTSNGRDGAYTNFFQTSFVNYAGETVKYSRGGQIIENVAIVPSYAWSWNGGPPSCGWYVNEIANCELKGSAIVGALGPGIYLRGPFAMKVTDCFISENWVGGIFLTDLSDLDMRGTRVVGNRGFGVGIYKANSHYFVDNDLWNPKPGLVTYQGGTISPTTSYTNHSYVTGELVPRAGWSADITNNTLSPAIGADTGMPIMFAGDTLPGGLSRDTVYFVRVTQTNGQNWQVFTSAGDALGYSGAPAIDITSAGTNWWATTPFDGSSFWAKDAEEIFIKGARTDMIYSKGIALDTIKRGTVSEVDMWDMGRNQKLLGHRMPGDTNVVGVYLTNCVEIKISGSYFSSAKDFTGGGVGGLLPVVYTGVWAEDSPNIGIAGNHFGRLNNGVLLDADSTFSPVDPRTANSFSPWTARPVNSASSMNPSIFNGVRLNQTNLIYGALPSGSTSFVAFSVASKIRLNDNLPSNNQEAIWALSSGNTLPAPSTAQPNAVALVQYYDGGTATHYLYLRFLGAVTTDWRDYYCDITELIGRDVEIVAQRSTNGSVQIYVDGLSRALGTGTAGGSPPSITNTVYAPYFVVGGWNLNYHRSQWFYGAAVTIGTSFDYAGIAHEKHWASSPSTKVIWDFDGASSYGVWDKSGNGVVGYLASLATAQAPTWGSDPFALSLYDSTGAAVEKLGPRSFKLPAGGGGSTNGSAVSVDGTYASPVNFADGSKIAVTKTGTNATHDIVPSSLTVGDMAQSVWTTTVGRGTLAARPAAAAGNAGYLYFATDDGNVYRSNGSTWDLFAISTGGGGSSIPTNGASPGWWVQLQPDLTYKPTNVLSSLSISGDLNIGGSITVSNPIPLSAIAPEALSESEAADLYQPLDPALSQLATLTLAPGDVLYVNGSTQLVALPKGTDGQVLKLASGIPSWATDSTGGTFAWDIDTGFSITNLDNSMSTVFTEAVPDGQTWSYDLQVVMAGATNGYQGSLFGRLSNRSGTPMLYTTNGPSGSTDPNTLAFVTNSGTNLVVLARGPSNQPFSGRLRGMRMVVTNAGAYASPGVPETNGLFAYWAMSGTGSTAETDLMGNLNMSVSAGDTIPTTNSTPLQPARYFNDGEDDYMVATNLAFASTDSFTIGGWVRADSPAATRYIMGRASGFSLRMASTDSTMRFVVANASTNKEVVGHNLGSATNYFFGASYNSTNGAIQLLICSPLGNNLYTGTFTNGVEASTNDLYISASATSQTLNWAGAIDDIWLSKRAMSTNALIQIYNSGSGLPLASWPVN